ncbi:MAG TPA: hypothetical protein VKU39_09425, partial [Streptosporangiaceae bacterium]|nr:hypothetical protein [Streptosporangiaceae bacterium]
WLVPPRDRPPRRAADLRARRAGDLLPLWARVAVWAVFIPVLAAPLLVLVHPVHGLTRISVYGYACATSGPRWPGLPILAAAAAIGAAGLLAAQLTLVRLARRPRPADDLDAARLDDLLRGISARAAAGGAAALALVLAAGITTAVHIGAHSMFCPARPGTLMPAYPWAVPLLPWLVWAQSGLLAAALAILVLCRRRDIPRVLPGLGPAR